MRVPRTLAAALALALTLAATGCSDSADPDSGPPVTGSPSASAAPQSKQVAWGAPADVLGMDMRPMRVTPVGVLYHKGPYQDGDKPENGWYLAIAIQAEAATSPEALVVGANGGGFEWRGSGQTIASWDGGATTAPWVGSVNEFTVDRPLEPGSPEVGITTFDVPSKNGGRLLYVSPKDNSITWWPVPPADQGTGLTKVRAKIKEFS
jgi:hypothetical protein